MTFVFQVDELPQNKVFDIFKTNKTVTPGDSVVYQTATAEVQKRITSVWTDKGLMKGYTAVGFADIKQPHEHLSGTLQDIATHFSTPNTHS